MKIGTLLVEIAADSAKFSQGVDLADIKLKGLAGRARTAVTSIAKYSAAAVAAGAATAAYLVKNALDAIDAQAKLAQKLNTTSASMASLTRAGELSGVGVDKIAQASGDLTRRLSQAAAQGGPVADALKRINISAQELQALPLDKRIETINSRLAEFVPAAQRAAVAGQLFGEEGSLAISQISAENLKRAREETEAFGLALSDVDAAKVEAANDAISGISQIFRGFVQQIAVKVAPILTALSELFIDNAKQAGGLGQAADKSFGFIVDATAFVIDAIEGIKRVFSVVADALIAGAAGIKIALLKPFESLSKLFSMLPGEAGQFFKDINANIEQELKITESVVSQAFGNINDTINEPMPGGKFKQFVAEAEEAATAAAEAAIKIREAASASMGGGDGESPADKKYKEQLQLRLDALREAYATEKQLLIAKQEEELELINEAYEAKLLSEEEFLAHEYEINATHQEALNQLEQDAADKRKAIADAERNAKLNIAKSIFGDLSTLMNTESRKLFEIGKAAAIAGATVSTYQGIANALADLPYPVNIAAAAAVGLKGFAQVQAIRSQSFGGGGGTATGSNTTAINAQSAPVQQGPSAGQTLRVEGLDTNALFSGADVRIIASKLVDFQRDGGEVILPA